MLAAKPDIEGYSPFHASPGCRARIRRRLTELPFNQLRASLFKAYDREREDEF
jgi:hypothetical protein